jgi:formylglycine-generating enzyme required for sulfatase activity
MKMNLRIFFFLAAILFCLPAPPSRAQDNTIADDQTNDVLTLKELMASGTVVTNTADIVLVKISPGLWAGKYEVTQDAYEKLMHGNPSAFASRQYPVDSVSWNDAMEFCRKLTAKERRSGDLPDGFSYSLPTESQWEMLSGDASLKDAVMALNGNSHASTAPVGSLGPNSLGLYDTRGNVMEWCLDSHDPQAYRVLRGGAWDTFDEPSSRTEFRVYAKPDDKKNDYGFRIVLQGSPK